MTREEKDLLLIDLCARLPYGVICKVIKNDNPFIGDCKLNINWLKDITSVFYEIKPYLRPLSAMTEEEKKEWVQLRVAVDKYIDGYHVVVDFYNKHHFDYRGLIEDGLALEAPEGMYKID